MPSGPSQCRLRQSPTGCIVEWFTLVHHVWPYSHLSPSRQAPGAGACCGDLVVRIDGGFGVTSATGGMIGGSGGNAPDAAAADCGIGGGGGVLVTNEIGAGAGVNKCGIRGGGSVLSDTGMIADEAGDKEGVMCVGSVSEGASTVRGTSDDGDGNVERASMTWGSGTSTT
mmetsp:Transcript_38734/g.102266  ORF Transcript_38734/g.102266 Transcript_38734/m.102266 type:complete len:170 (-) Transcript_38734:1144-1653(-)